MKNQFRPGTALKPLKDRETNQQSADLKKRLSRKDRIAGAIERYTKRPEGLKTSEDFRKALLKRGVYAPPARPGKDLLLGRPAGPMPSGRFKVSANTGARVLTAAKTMDSAAGSRPLGAGRRRNSDDLLHKTAGVRSRVAPRTSQRPARRTNVLLASGSDRALGRAKQDGTSDHPWVQELPENPDPGVMSVHGDKGGVKARGQEGGDRFWRAMFHHYDFDAESWANALDVSWAVRRVPGLQHITKDHQAAGFDYLETLFEKGPHRVFDHGFPAAERLRETYKAAARKTDAVRDEIARRYPDLAEVDGTWVNAIKHTLWSLDLARNFGLDFAKKITDAHERGVREPAKVIMDLHNNQVGRSLAEAAANTDKDSMTLVLEALEQGKLITRTPRTESDLKGHKFSPERP